MFEKDVRELKKRFFASLIAICMVIGMLPATALAAEATTVTDEAELKAVLAAGGEVVLGADIAVGSNLTIPAGKTVALDPDRHCRYQR